MRFRNAAATALLLMLANPSFAQEHCLPTDTPRDCFQRLIPAPASLPATAAQKSGLEAAANTVKSIVASTNHGVTDVTAPTRSAIKDFMSLMAGTFDTATLGDDGSKLNLDYSLPLPILGASRPLRLSTTLTDPVLSQNARNALQTLGPERPADLEKSLTALDDITVALTFAPMSRHFGASLEPHRPLFAALFLATAYPTPEAAQQAIGQAMASAGISEADLDRTFAQLVPDDSGRAATLTSFESAARSLLATVAPDISEPFAAILKNQSSVYVSARYRPRKGFIGPPEWGVDLTWALGSQNLNRFYRREGRTCDAASLDAAAAMRCRDAFREYVARTTRAHTADRLALTVHINGTTETTVAFPDAEPYTHPATRTLAYSASYGRPFASLLRGQAGRFDLTVTGDGHTRVAKLDTTGSVFARRPRADIYQSVSSGDVLPPPREPFTAAMTYTQQLSERVFVPLSLVYSERTHVVRTTPDIVSPPMPSRLVEVRETGMSVHVGVSYRITPPELDRRRKNCDCCC